MLAKDRADAALLFHAVVVGLAVMHQARMNADSEQEIKTGVEAMLRLLSSSGNGKVKDPS